MRKGDRLPVLLLMTPALVIIAVFTLYPIARVLALSLHLTDYGFAEATFVGVENYEELLGHRFFRGAVWNTVLFTLLATLTEVALGLVLALLFNRRFPGRRLLLPTVVFPFMLSTMVVCAIWRSWFHFDFGFLNNVLRLIGIDGVAWLFDPDLALYSIVLVDLWQTAPLCFLIILAGLQAIPPQIVEAARLDGARSWQILVFITLPMIKGHILLAALLRTIESFKIFDKVYALTGGGPGNATETLSMYVYRLGFRFFDVGLASAAAVIMLVVAGLLAAFYAWRIMQGGTMAGSG